MMKLFLSSQWLPLRLTENRCFDLSECFCIPCSFLRLIYSVFLLSCS